MIRLSTRDTVESIKSDIKAFRGQPGFVSPDGIFYEVRSNPHYGQYHGMWVVDHWNELKKMGANLPDEEDFPFDFNNFPQDLLKNGSDSVRNLLVGEGWIQVFDGYEFLIMRMSENGNLLLNFLLKNGSIYSDDDELEIIELAAGRRENYSWQQIKEDGFRN